MADRQTIVFDLDDTLYLERQFVASGYDAADRWLAQNRGTAGLKSHCMELFNAGQRTNIFDLALARLGMAEDKNLIMELVGVYRHHEPQIALEADAARYLGRTGRSGRYAIITDGPTETQMAKIRALGLERLIGRIVCTGQWGAGFSKPHPRAFEVVEQWAGCTGADLAYVADNPKKDFVTPNARGWLSVQIRRAERVHLAEAPDEAHAPRAMISSLDELDGCLADLCRRGETSPDRRAGAS